MLFRCQRSVLRGEVVIPGSKSHTIRAVMIGGLADGESRIEAPLISADAVSAAGTIPALGATVRQEPGVWRIRGCGNRPALTRSLVDVGNSGTTMNIMLGMSTLIRDGELVLTGDEQIQRRPSGALADALCRLGASVTAERGNGCPPFRIRGTLKGGKTALEARSSQYLTSLLLACPLAEGDSEITVPLLKEKPYVQMTLDWLASQGISVEHDAEFSRFRIPGRQQYRAFSRRIPADFSTASFFLCAGALSGNSIVSRGLDLNDSQGDKAVVDYLRAMGAKIEVSATGIKVSGDRLHGIEIDLDATPDALPIMAVTGCFASGQTVLRNVAHARIKETDRIAVMACELRKLGAQIEELPDGLVIHESRLTGAAVEGHGDHRVVMALAIAGFAIPGETVISTAEAAGVTFPDFSRFMRALGGNLSEG